MLHYIYIYIKSMTVVFRIFRPTLNNMKYNVVKIH